MKKLFLLRGVPGCGKSTFLRKYEDVLKGYVIGADDIRLLYSPTVYPKGKFTKKVNPENDRQVWEFIHNLVQQRLLKGYTTIVDATHCNVDNINYYKGFCLENNVECVVVTFDETLETCQQRNKSRHEWQEVPEEIVERMHNNMQTPVPSWCKVITKEEFEKIIKLVQQDSSDYTPISYDKFEKIVVFGDIHGCWDPLKEYFDKNPINSNTKYIFVGDYEDRGLQNKEVFEFLLEHKRDGNFLFLKGNHTQHTLAYSMDQNIVSKEFRERTIKQLETLDKSELKKFCKRQGDFVYFLFNNQKYLVTHAGVSSLPNSFTNEKDIVNGVGDYGDSEKIDQEFRVNNTDVVTIHGHRNLNDIPYDSGNETGAYNLEGRVEFGGYLRIVEINKQGIKCHQIKNNSFRKIGSDEDIIKQLTDSRFVRVKNLKNDIKSYSFTKECFYDKRWDNLTEKARGLFCRDTKVVARSFDKFFNIDEKESLATIVDKMQYPVNVFRKENGYLGIVSYDSQVDDLFVASKSTNEGGYALYFKSLLQEKGLYNKLYCFLKQNDYSLVFEICNSDLDPHMVEYNEPTLFLLEAFKNSLKEETLPYKELVEISKQLEVNCKEVFRVLWNKEEMVDFINEYESLYKFPVSQKIRIDEGLEGFVLEDSNHFRVKYKTHWYQFWKHIRNKRGNVQVEECIDKCVGFADELQRVVDCVNKYNQQEFMVKNLIGQETFSVIKLRRKMSEEK